jgi:D-serine deaminase-like pyridoxal phosphate-dependent protein
MQLDSGAVGLTVAKVGEAIIMAEASDDLLMAYPAVNLNRSVELGKLASTKTLRVAIDSSYCIKILSDAAVSTGSTIGILVELDVGMRRMGVQTAEALLALAQEVDMTQGLRLDGIMFYPGHVCERVQDQEPVLKEIDAKLAEAIELWSRSGIEAKIVSGGSTPTAFQSHMITNMTEIRPGTYIFNDMNCVSGGFASIEDCAARLVCTVISDAVPRQVVIDAGSKTLSSDLCNGQADKGYGYICEYPQAKIFKLNEEHGMVDITDCDVKPEVGQKITIIPNHICVCVNLQNIVWWREEGQSPEQVIVDARGKLT